MLRGRGTILAAAGAALLLPAAAGQASRTPLLPGPAVAIEADPIAPRLTGPLGVSGSRTGAGAAPAGYWDGARDQLVHARRFPDVRNRMEVYQFPLKDRGRIGSGFGRRWHPIYKAHRFHPGWDLPRERGTAVYAASTGRVEFSGWRAGYGHAVVIRHVDGRSTLYGHLAERYVEEGEWARGGETIVGRVGSSGLSTGPHLHFEVRDRRGQPTDPTPLVRFFTPPK